MTRKQRIHDALFVKLKPDPFVIENESHRHSVPPGSETHFKIIVVSSLFVGLLPLARHRLVNNLLAQEFSSGLHALSLHLYTPQQWQEKNSKVPASPACQKQKKPNQKSNESR